MLKSKKETEKSQRDGSTRRIQLNIEALEMEGVVMSQGMQTASRSYKEQFSPGVSRKNIAMLTP